jgi:DNA-binding NarL/FixJ family response regulator
MQSTKREWSRKKQPVGPGGYTDRERELLVYLSKGFDVPGAAELMGLSRYTVADYVRSIFKKMNACTQAEAVYRAVKEGVIP